MTKLLALTMLLIGNAFAGGDGHGGGHATDLIPSFVNIFILASFLIWKLKGPARDYFVKKSTSVSEVLERASVKAKEAEMMLQMQQKKVDGMEEEITRIFSDADVSVSNFKNEYATDVDERIKKLKEDAAHKIEAEKKQMMDQVNSLLLDEVISKTKTMIKGDQGANEQITKNLLQGLK
jgi:F0F1-type ATP synthase membrane subunit b/b'